MFLLKCNYIVFYNRKQIVFSTFQTNQFKHNLLIICYQQVVYLLEYAYVLFCNLCVICVS